jgi:hypothetical protein
MVCEAPVAVRQVEIDVGVYVTLGRRLRDQKEEPPEQHVDAKAPG